MFDVILSRKSIFKFLFLISIPLLSNCSLNRHDQAPHQHTAEGLPIRFLLTFDDGPSGARDSNPTEKIRDTLASNGVQSNIKAIFFVQTRAVRGGGTEVGQKLLHRLHGDGHLLAFHSATTHHDNHRFLSAVELENSLQLGIADLKKITGAAPMLVRPPYWSYSKNTLSRYDHHGLHMLLTDLSANDGKIHGVNWSWHKRSNLYQQLQRVKGEIAKRTLRTVDGAIPIVVTFHDVNPYTARNLEVYLHILVDIAKELNLPLAEKPFYDERAQLEKAALARAVSDQAVDSYIPGFWGWWWK
jgi:peptidoglycan/xylan/chitin deacetylase (PgdA/CDA1 family)